jgi:4'-phosphopantetheinyl transferase
VSNVNICFLAEVDWHLASSAATVLGAADIHVYRVRISGNLQHLQIFFDTLTQAEKERGQKYHQLKDRQRFVVSRGAQRHILARYISQNPAEINFAIGDNKKPYLSNPGGISIQYNITHAGDYILLAVSNSPVGADVEYIDPNFPFDDILEEHFNEAEVSFIKQNNTAQRFYLLWTRKEALLKATAQGLGEHLKVTPSLNGEHVFPNELSGSNENWEISSFALPGGHMGSIANTGSNAVLHFFDVVL